MIGRWDKGWVRVKYKEREGNREGRRTLSWLFDFIRRLREGSSATACITIKYQSEKNTSETERRKNFVSLLLIFTSSIPSSILSPAQSDKETYRLVTYSCVVMVSLVSSLEHICKYQHGKRIEQMKGCRIRCIPCMPVINPLTFAHKSSFKSLFVTK